MKTICVWDGVNFDTVESVVDVISSRGLENADIDIYNTENGDFIRTVSVCRDDGYTYDMFALFEGEETGTPGEYEFSWYNFTERCYNTWQEARAGILNLKPGVYKISQIFQTPTMYLDLHDVETITISR